MRTWWTEIPMLFLKLPFWCLYIAYVFLSFLFIYFIYFIFIISILKLFLFLHFILFYFHYLVFLNCFGFLSSFCLKNIKNVQKLFAHSEYPYFHDVFRISEWRHMHFVDSVSGAEDQTTHKLSERLKVVQMALIRDITSQWQAAERWSHSNDYPGVLPRCGQWTR